MMALGLWNHDISNYDNGEQEVGQHNIAGEGGHQFHVIIFSFSLLTMTRAS